MYNDIYLFNLEDLFDCIPDDTICKRLSFRVNTEYSK